MSSLQHLADTAANLNAQLCELNELRERVRKALLSAPKPPKPKHWNVRSTIPRSHLKSTDRERSHRIAL
jgi:hypothetical protein